MISYVFLMELSFDTFFIFIFSKFFGIHYDILFVRGLLKSGLHKTHCYAR